MRIFRILIVCFVIIPASTVLAQPGPYVEELIDFRFRDFGQQERAPLPQILGQPAVPVVLSFHHEVDQQILESLAQTPGVELRWVEGRPLHRGRFVSALLTRGGLLSLSRRTDLDRISAGIERGPAPPLWHTTSMSGIEAARRTWIGEHSLTGRGVTIADIDTSIEVFHPDFFSADGGAYDWLDTNENGQFDPGLDAVDLDRDGEVDDEEILTILTATPLDGGTLGPVPARPEGFSASWDWLFADTNGNELRDYGPEGGFDDLTPAFGEPLFIVDDINGDDSLNADERLLRLSSSRIRAVWVGYPTGQIRVFRRGTDLSELPYGPFGQGAYGMPEAMHATGVVSIAAGGVPHANRALTGFAPEAEILVAYNGTGDIGAATMWALDEGADVVLHEYAPWTGVILDGSDPLSEMIDESTANDDVVHVCPVGNTGGSQKHTMTTMEPGSTWEFQLDVPRGWNFNYIYLTFHWRPRHDALGVELVAPDGESIELTGGVDEFYVDGTPAVAIPDVSPGGTSLFHVYAAGVPVADGLWLFRMTNTSHENLTIHGYASDDLSAWSQGVAWDAKIATDISNIGLPSTAESCIAVGAVAGHDSRDGSWFRGFETQGEIRTYSGRGPRIDGLLKPDIAAPDNPFASFCRWPDMDLEPDTYWVFGGTSGAGPHVAGAALLLRQANPGATGDRIIDVLLEGALSDDLTGEVPNFDYGYGRVNLALALGESVGGDPPVLTLEAPDFALLGEEVFVVPSVDDPDGDETLAEIRWDDRYDGLWDGDFGPIESLSVTIPEDDEGRYPVKAQVRDESGLIDNAIVWISYGETYPTDGDADADADGDADTDPDGDIDGGDGGVVVRDDDGCGCRATGGGTSTGREGRGIFTLLFLGL